MRRLANGKARICDWADDTLAKNRRVERAQLTATVEMVKDVVPFGVDFQRDAIWQNTTQCRLLLDVAQISSGKHGHDRSPRRLQAQMRSKARIS